MLDFTDRTSKLEKYLRKLLDNIADWIAAHPISDYVTEGFKTSIEYSAGVFVGGFLFLLLFYVLEGDVLFSAVGVFLLVWAARSRLSRRVTFGSSVAAIWLLFLYPRDPDFGVALLTMVFMVLILTVYQIIGPVILALIFYGVLFILHGTFRLLSKPKKGIVGTVSLIIAIGNPIANHVFEYAK